jgi:FG-GAP repeat protein/flagellar hook capping protein FlgD
MSCLKVIQRGSLGLVLLLGWAASAFAGPRMLTGVESGDAFGSAVTGAGDVNGDGIADFLVGAPGARGTAGITGTVSVYFGNVDSVFDAPDLVLEGEVAGDAFGFAVATAGDVNGDGYDDFLVGAPRADATALDAGRIYLFAGGPVLSASPARFWDGDLAGAHYGASVAGGFDFNRDGFMDFAAGAPESNQSATRAGQVKIYLGASNMGAVSQPTAFRFTGDQANWALGWSIDAAGDVDGDNYDDLIAGAPQPFDVNTGRAVIWFGQSSTLATPSRLVLSGEVGSDRFGFSVSGAGDRNQDGYDDVIVGAPGHDSQGFDKGAAYLFLGGFTVNGISDWKTTGGAGLDSLGYSVDGGKDVDGDQTSDLVIGAPGADNPAVNAGEVRLFYGGSYPSTAADTVFSPVVPDPGFESEDRFGAAVALGGDIAGGGRSEVLAGAPYGNDAAGAITGYVDLLPVLGVPVPVRLLSFFALRANGEAQLRWELEDTGLLAGLRVDVEERGDWQSLGSGWLAPSVTQFVDSNPPSGDARYRLSGLTRSGEVMQLGIADLSGREHPSVALRALDNPAYQTLAVRATLPAGFSELVIIDTAGREVRRLWRGTSQGETVLVNWDGRDREGHAVAEGLYVLHLRGERTSLSTKFVKLNR